MSSSASRLSTDLHADRHARAHQITSREYQIETADRMSNLASGLTLFIAAWPVQAFFLIFISATGWTAIPGGLLVWFIGSYALTVSASELCLNDHLVDLIASSSRPESRSRLHMSLPSFSGTRTWIQSKLWNIKQDPKRRHSSALSLSLSVCFVSCSSYTLPIHSALIDLLGQSLLVAAYEIASALGTQVKS